MLLQVTINEAKPTQNCEMDPEQVHLFYKNIGIKKVNVVV